MKTKIIHRVSHTYLEWKIISQLHTKKPRLPYSLVLYVEQLTHFEPEIKMTQYTFLKYMSQFRQYVLGVIRTRFLERVSYLAATGLFKYDHRLQITRAGIMLSHAQGQARWSGCQIGFKYNLISQG